MSEKAKLTPKASESKGESSSSQTKKLNFFWSAASPFDHILFLQRTVGNQSVGKILKSSIIQPKLTIGKPGDVYEQEADRVAEQVMRMSDPGKAEGEGVHKYDKIPSIQRVCTECEEELHRQPIDEEEEVLQMKEVGGETPEISQDVESQINSIRVSGESLPDPVRSFYEPRFGKDFSQVRVHTDAQAAESAKAVNAYAYTAGRDIVFAAGQYAPETMTGRRLLAHELAHVVQQGGASVSLAPMEQVSRGYDALEEHADLSAVGAVKLKDIAQNTMPRLRSGLRLSRRPGPAPATDLKCEPEPKTWDEISNIPGVKPGTLGLTDASEISMELKVLSEKGVCKIDIVKEPRLSFDHFVYTKPGDYKQGRTINIPFDPCKGRVGDLYFRITNDMSKKIKQGEIEHCEDEKLAFALSFKRYMQAVREVAASGIRGKDVPTCQTEILKLLKKKTGIEYSQWQSVAECLLEKTLERDQEWHKVKIFKNDGSLDASKVSKFILDPNCASLTLELDHTKLLPEVGKDKHPSKDLIKGCGEKQP